MTRCNNSDVNLKSTAYNQTGQTYFQRLSAYNSMSSHLRRVHLAKSVIDCRNEQSLRFKERRCRSASCGRLHSNDLTKEVIDRLSLDTSNHPQDVLKMTLNRKFAREREYCDRCGDRYDHQNFTQSRIRGDFTNFERNRSASKTRNSSTPPTSVREARTSRSPICNKADCIRQGYRQLEERKHRCGDRGVYCTTTFECMSNGSNSSLNSLHDVNHSGRYEYSAESKDNIAEKEEEANYARFVYNITQDIVQNGLYSDKQLLEVFKKHIQKNKNTLNMNKMLQEIYQLKTSLEVSEESELDNEIEALVYARKFSSAYELKPPTPPKVLDENKVIEKLLSYQTSMESRNRSSSPGNKSVVLVDANPELYVTERDVLLTLMEVDIDPDQAQYICKSLFHKSRDTIPNEMDSPSSASETKDTPPEEIVIVETQAEENVKRISAQRKKYLEDVGLTTADLVSQKDQVVQVQDLKNGQNLSHDNYTEPMCIPCQTMKDATIQIDLNLCAAQLKEIKPCPAKGRTSESSQTVSLTKRNVGKTGKKTATVRKVERSRSSTRGSQSQTSTEQLSRRFQKVEEEKEEKQEKEEIPNGPQPAPRKVKGAKAKTSAQSTRMSRVSSTSNKSSATVISLASQRKQVDLGKRKSSDHAESKESFSEKSSRISSTEPENETDRYSSDYEDVDEDVDEADVEKANVEEADVEEADVEEADVLEADVEEADDSEIERDSSDRKSSWIETRDVDTDVSETNGYEYSGPEDTILTENETSIHDKNK